jgi:hypothetical protein
MNFYLHLKDFMTRADHFTFKKTSRMDLHGLTNLLYSEILIALVFHDFIIHTTDFSKYPFISHM